MASETENRKSETQIITRFSLIKVFNREKSRDYSCKTKNDCAIIFVHLLETPTNVTRHVEESLFLISLHVHNINTQFCDDPPGKHTPRYRINIYRRKYE